MYFIDTSLTNKTRYTEKTTDTAATAYATCLILKRLLSNIFSLCELTKSINKCSFNVPADHNSSYGCLCEHMEDPLIKGKH